MEEVGEGIYWIERGKKGKEKDGFFGVVLVQSLIHPALFYLSDISLIAGSKIYVAKCKKIRIVSHSLILFACHHDSNTLPKSNFLFNF